MAGGGIGEAMLLGAAGGGITSLIKGEDPLPGILLGGGLGAAGGALFGAGGGAGGGAASGSGTASQGVSLASAGVPQVATPAAFSDEALGLTKALGSSPASQVAANPIVGSEGIANIQLANLPNQVASNAIPVAQASGAQAASPSLIDQYRNLSNMQKLGVNVAGGLALGSIFDRNKENPEEEEPNWDRWKKFRPTFYAAQGGMVPEYAGGGGIQNLYTSGYGPLDEPVQMQVPNQQELSSVPAAGYLGNSVKMMASGGISSLGSYSDGGRLLKGPGDGMSDHIPASIGGKQPARLAEGEFVIPADVVSHLGNGSTDAGAKQLYAMMSRIRKARTGSKKQGRQINPRKLMVA